LYNKVLLKCEFNQSHWLELLKSIHTKFILNFFNIPTNFGSLNYFLGVKEIRKRLKRPRSAELHIWPTTTVRRGAAACLVQDYWPGPTVKAAQPAYSRAAYGPRRRARVSGRSHVVTARGAAWWRGARWQPAGRGGKCRPG
jgi:hypothetical protein